MPSHRHKTHEAVLAAIQGRRVSAKGKIRANCPVCPERVGKTDRDTSLVFYRASGFFKCFRCRVMGVVGAMSMGTAPVSYHKVSSKPKFEAAGGPPGFRLLDDDAYRDWSFGDVIEYLEGRRITKVIVQAARIGVVIGGDWRLAGRVIIPHLKPDGTWWGYTARDYTGKRPKKFRFRFPDDMDSENNVFNEVCLSVETDVPVLAMEGVIDSLLYLPDATASQGIPKDSHYDKFKKAKRPVVFCLDGDAWRKARALAMRLRFDGRRSGYVRLPPKIDPNDTVIDPEELKQRAIKAIEERIHV